MTDRFGSCLSRIAAASLQRARLKVVESLRNSKGRVVVVATDVAARGLDIPSVATIVHYDAARNIDTFVHRSGRTAVSLKTLSTALEKEFLVTEMNTMCTGLESLNLQCRENNIVPLAV